MSFRHQLLRVYLNMAVIAVIISFIIGNPVIALRILAGIVILSILIWIIGIVAIIMSVARFVDSEEKAYNAYCELFEMTKETYKERYKLFFSNNPEDKIKIEKYTISINKSIAVLEDATPKILEFDLLENERMDVKEKVCIIQQMKENDRIEYY